MPNGLAGQWLGVSDDEVPARIILDLDDGSTHVRGTARVFFSDGSPGAICELEFPRDAANFSAANVSLYWIPPGQAAMITTGQVRAMFPQATFSEVASIEFQRTGDNSLVFSWATEAPSSGSAKLFRSELDSPSKLQADSMTWPDFKSFALQNTAGSFIFRGQPGPFKLRTAFHRTYRKDLIRFVSEDIIVAYKLLTARTNHLFDLEKPLERGAFWNLLQHHGYPTPLLDWSYSPFVAAFFAFRRRKPKDDLSQKVRILAFHKQQWIENYNQIDNVNFTDPHFSILEALAIENPRAIPQQALSTLTNIDDIEAYIRLRENEKGYKFIHAIDLDADLRPNIMAELSLMGITAGSLFPGLDGACEELAGRFFHHQVPPLQSN